jgi:hypothetical protein
MPAVSFSVYEATQLQRPPQNALASFRRKSNAARLRAGRNPTSPTKAVLPARSSAFVH